MKTAKEWIESVKESIFKIVDNYDSETATEEILHYLSTISHSDFKHLDKSVETQLKEDKETPNLGQLFKNSSDCYADTHWYSDDTIPPTKVEGEVIQAMTEQKFIEVVSNLLTNKSTVEQPKVRVNEDHRCTNYDPFGNCNCTQEVSVNEDAVDFAEWVTFNCKWDDDYKVYSCDLKEGAFNIDELYQNYLEDKHGQK